MKLDVIENLKSPLEKEHSTAVQQNWFGTGAMRYLESVGQPLTTQQAREMGLSSEKLAG